MRIGLFDSGIGGLCVLKEFISKYPNNEYIYYGDTKNMPYGDKSIDLLFSLSIKIIDYLIDSGANIIIIACGTVSSNIIDKLRSYSSVLIYDIISPVINYISKLDNVGVIGTSNTISSGVFSSITCLKTPLLVPLIESNRSVYTVLNYYLSSFREFDYLVLGCTHYPLIEEVIHDILPNISCINMGKVLVDSINITNNSECRGISIHFSELNDSVISNINTIIGNGYNIV